MIFAALYSLVFVAFLGGSILAIDGLFRIIEFFIDPRNRKHRKRG